MMSARYIVDLTITRNMGQKKSVEISTCDSGHNSKCNVTLDRVRRILCICVGRKN